MEPFDAAVFAGIVLITLLALIKIALIVCGAREECLALLKSWAEERGMEVVRARKAMAFPSGFMTDPGQARQPYSLVVDDRDGHRRFLRADVVGRWSGHDFTPRSVDIRAPRGLIRGATLEGHARFVAGEGHPLWDAWLDG
jgi:hypothetical protein